MAGKSLKDALRDAGLTPEAFAEVIQVDPKSVQRWVTGTTVPYRRHRAAISRALNLTEHDLRPDHTTEPVEIDKPDEPEGSAGEGLLSDVAGTWAHADTDGAPGLPEFINAATGPLDVLDSCCGLEITEEAIAALLARADAGEPVRILTDGQQPHWEQLLDHPGIGIFVVEIPGEYWLIKTADRMLLTINLDHEPGDSSPPILQLTRSGGQGLFQRLTDRFEELWDHTKEPDTADIVAEPACGSPPDSPQDHPQPTPASPAGGRRWPHHPD